MQRQIIGVAAVIGALSVFAVPAAAGVGDMVACRTIEKPEERLACYDREADKVSQDLKVHETNFFGFLGLGATKEKDFGKPVESPKGESEIPEINSITSEIVDSGNLGGKQTIVLDNGQVWTLTDYSHVHLKMSATNNARIERALLGYLMTVNDGSVRWQVQRVK